MWVNLGTTLGYKLRFWTEKAFKLKHVLNAFIIQFKCFRVFFFNKKSEIDKIGS